MRVIQTPSPNQDERPGPAITQLIVHYTGMQSAQAAIGRLTDAAAKVSSHYLITENGEIHQLVAEQNRAWHAGVSYWRGQRNLNDSSIGIELVNPGHEWGYQPFPGAQIAALIGLGQAIVARHFIPARNVLAHSDIAADRKQDPGELFPWAQLAEAGIGLWPTRAAALHGTVAEALDIIGYDPAVPEKLRIMAFQRHWHPAEISGTACPATRTRLAAVLDALDT